MFVQTFLPLWLSVYINNAHKGYYALIAITHYEFNSFLCSSVSMKLKVLGLTNKESAEQSYQLFFVCFSSVPRKAPFKCLQLDYGDFFKSVALSFWTGVPLLGFFPTLIVFFIPCHLNPWLHCMASEAVYLQGGMVTQGGSIFSFLPFS